MPLLPESLRNAAEQATGLLYRLRRYADPAGLYDHFRFQDLRREFYRQLWRDAAAAIGAEAEEWASDYTRIARAGRMTVVKLGSVMLDDHITLEIMGNKALTHWLLREKGLAAPPATTFTLRTFDRAEKFAARNGWPVVVKPVAGTGGGRGVTTGIGDAAALRRAATYAARFGAKLLIERQVAGHSYRLLYLDGVLIDAIRRDSPVLVGDGRRSIRQLARRENARRLAERPIRSLSPLKLDQDSLHTLRSLGLSPRSVLPEGRQIAVKRAVNENDAAQNHGVKDRVHPETAALCGRLVRDLGVRFAGVDLLVQDIGAPLRPDNGVIGEINTTPGIHHHYLVSDPTRAVRVAEIVLSHMFARDAGVMVLADRAAAAA